MDALNNKLRIAEEQTNELYDQGEKLSWKTSGNDKS